MHALRNVHRMLVPDGLLVDLHPVSPRPRVRADGSDIGPWHQERWVREWLRPTEGELTKAVRQGLFEPLAEVALDVTHRYDDAQEFLDSVDEWEYGWISDRLRRRTVAASPPVEVVEDVVLRTFRAR